MAEVQPGSHGATKKPLPLHFKAPEAYFSIQVGDALLIVLNSNFTDETKLSDTQLPWLKKGT